MSQKRITSMDIRHAPKGQAPFVCLTAYTAPMASILDKHADILLVGDSLGMVLYGFDSTLPVTLDMMIAHGAAVVRSSKHACVVVDMPFGSYQQSKEQAFANAARIMQETGCQAVKLEGGIELAETIKFLVSRGIPVMGHIGLMPQHVKNYGGFACQGTTKEGRKRIIDDAAAINDSCAFACVIEGVKEELARELTKKMNVPTIGIGASAMCDGQVLVSEDLVGLFTGFKPKFVKRYANIATQIDDAVAKFSEDVRARRFPDEEHCFI